MRGGSRLEGRCGSDGGLALGRLALSAPIFALLVACSGGGGGGALAASDGGASGSSSADGGSGPGTDDATQGPPHALGVLVLGESHLAGQSTMTPLVSVSFVPSTAGVTACATKVEGCAVTVAPRCKSDGCASGEVCAFDASCKPTCKKIPTCNVTCADDETCAPDPKSKTGAGKCQKKESFDAGPLAFSGTTTAISLFPPYAYRAQSDGAPFVSGASLRVKAQGAVGAGFAAFDESFTATSFIQTKPALEKLHKEDVFGQGPLTVGWVPGEDAIVVTVASQYGSAQCPADDAKGSFAVPRAVIDAVRSSPDGSGKSGSVTASIARQRRELKKDKRTVGSLSGATVEPVGWLELVTSSMESSAFQGCSGESVACADACVDVSVDADNCGACGHACGASEHCAAGKCVAGAVCTSGPEDTLAACSDGCSNDGDPYIDCDDYDCCAVRPGCPSTTACGKK